MTPEAPGTTRHCYRQRIWTVDSMTSHFDVSKMQKCILYYRVSIQCTRIYVKMNMHIMKGC